MQFLSLAHLKHLHFLPLRPQPHLDALAVTLRRQRIDARLLLEHAKRRQAVADRLQGAAAVGERDAPKLAHIHELDALAELALLESVAVRHGKMLFLHADFLHAVNAENDRIVRRVVCIVGNQIEVKLRKKNRHGLDHALMADTVEPSIAKRSDALLAYGGGEPP